MYNPKDPEDSAGRLFSWLCVNHASLIAQREYYDRSDDRLWNYELWRLPNGELIIREAGWGRGGPPSEQESGCDSLEDFQQYVREDIKYRRWVNSAEGHAH